MDCLVEGPGLAAFCARNVYLVTLFSSTYRARCLGAVYVFLIIHCDSQISFFLHFLWRSSETLWVLWLHHKIAKIKSLIGWRRNGCCRKNEEKWPKKHTSHEAHDQFNNCSIVNFFANSNKKKKKGTENRSLILWQSIHFNYFISVYKMFLFMAFSLLYCCCEFCVCQVLFLFVAKSYWQTIFALGEVNKLSMLQVPNGNIFLQFHIMRYFTFII